VVSIGNDALQVPPVQVPLGNMTVKYIEVEWRAVIVSSIGSDFGRVKRDKLVQAEGEVLLPGTSPRKGST